MKGNQQVNRAARIQRMKDRGQYYEANGTKEEREAGFRFDESTKVSRGRVGGKKNPKRSGKTNG